MLINLKDKYNIHCNHIIDLTYVAINNSNNNNNYIPTKVILNCIHIDNSITFIYNNCIYKLHYY